jgi:cellulose synthase/poly-beta-1,6-N-acetylglucosamine synthase-like glycosyltransferase
MFDPQAVRRLVAPLREPRVGGVCGRLVFHKPAGGVTDEGVYWRLENRLKEYESAWDSCLGANGAIYAIRPELFWDALPDNTIVDDFVIGMKVREQGYRFLFAPAAEAHEELPATVAGEWKRRVRIGAGDYQALVLCRRCLAPGFGRFAWMFWSHKVLRWFTPHLLALVAALALAQYPFATAVALGAVLLAGAAGYAGRNVRGAWIRPFQLGAYFLAMQAALAAGFVRFCRGGLAGTWERTERGRERDQRSEVSGQKKTER